MSESNTLMIFLAYRQYVGISGFMIGMYSGPDVILCLYSYDENLISLIVS